MSFSLLTFLIFRVLPEIVSVFKEIGNKPPPLTQAVIDIQAFVSTNYMWLIPLIIAAIALVIFWARRNLPFLQHQVLKLPLLGNLYRRSVLLSFLPPFTLLLRKKISPEKIASTLKHSFSKQSLLVEILGAFESGLKKGERLTKPLLESPLFETGETELLIIAEESSRVPEILEKILDQLRREQEDELKRLVTLLEPAIILFIGTIVLFFVLTFLLPLIGADLGGE
jgi:type II secretory pathway component PulF